MSNEDKDSLQMIKASPDGFLEGMFTTLDYQDSKGRKRRDSVSSGYPNTKNRVENMTRAGVFEQPRSQGLFPSLVPAPSHGKGPRNEVARFFFWIADESLSRYIFSIFSIETKRKAEYF